METTILTIASYVFDGFRWLMFIYILMSWIPSLSQSKFGEVVGFIVEPYLGIFRKFIPPLGGMDFSPILAILAYSFLVNFAMSGLQFLLELIF